MSQPAKAAPQRITAVFLDVVEYLSEHTGGAHGYAIVTAIHSPSGSAYPVLRRLVAADWATVTEDTATTPPRLVYALTPDGLAAARALLADRRPPPALAATG